MSIGEIIRPKEWLKFSAIRQAMKPERRRSIIDYIIENGIENDIDAQRQYIVDETNADHKSALVVDDIAWND